MRKQLPMCVGLAVLFVGSFVILNWPYRYVIAVQSETSDCFFLFGRTFLLEFFDHPAGLLRYAGRFLGQFYHVPWLGALIVSGCITFFGILFQRVLSKIDETATVVQTLLPCLLLLTLHTSTLVLIHDTLGLCASCVCFLGFLCWRGKSARRIYALMTTPVLYLVVGVYAWFFVVWVFAFECFDRPLRQGLAFKIIYPVYSIAVPLAAWRWIFPIPLRSALICPIMYDAAFRTSSPQQAYQSYTMDGILGVALCGTLLLMPFWGRLFGGGRRLAFWQIRSTKSTRICLAVVISVLVLLFHLVRYDAQHAEVAACRKLYKERRWDALLARAKWNPYGDVRVQFMTNFALSQKGTLLDEMFRYPQPWGTRGLFMNFSGSPVSPAQDDTEDGMYNSDLLYEMGHAVYSFRHAYNCMCLRGRTYDTLKRVAKCSMVNGQYAMADKYLNLLEKTFFHREFARRYKAIIADPAAAQKEFDGLRKRLPTVDGFGRPIVHFITLLDAKQDNRMAFDYLMAWLLLEKRPDSLSFLAANIEGLRTAGYTSIPAHCQEAILVMERGERTTVDLKGFSCDAAIVARVDVFIEELSRVWGRQNALEDLRARYGDTYMFYFYCVTPINDAQRMEEVQRGMGATATEE